MPDISIIIVNYNVRYFLDQCLRSIYNNTGVFSVQVIVVDNNSADDSVQMLENQFPQVELIQSKVNLGFSKGNNLALDKVKGKYILFLNPDTIIGTDTLNVCYQYLENNPSTGAVCVRMIDGAGNYLPESKRGNPTFSASVFKMTGFYKLFPKNRFFNQYYFGHIPEFQEAEIEVMTGAFIFISPAVLKKIGTWDESFFMYGEDIDLSYRIRNAGYSIWYLPQTSIIHFKGESTRKATYQYIHTFYSAMNIFINKHYKNSGKLYVAFLNTAVYLRTGLAVFIGFFRKFLPFIIDALLIYCCLVWLRSAWGSLYFNNSNYIGEGFLKVNAPVYTFIWVLTAFLTGKYFSNVTIAKILKSTLIGTFIILVVYALFNSDYRNSRTIILVGTFFTFIIFTLTAILKNVLLNGTFSLTEHKQINYLVIGDIKSTDKIKLLMHQPGSRSHFAGSIPADGSANNIGCIADLTSIIEAYQLDEIIFSQRELKSDQMILLMSQYGKQVKFRIMPENAVSILSSDSKNTKGELFTIPLQYHLNEEKYRVEKRIFDLIMGVVLLMLSPLLIFFFSNKAGYLKNCIDTILGSKTMVGYISHSLNFQLPFLKDGVFDCNLYYNIDQDAIWLENVNYARNYHIRLDWKILIRKLKHLDGSTGGYSK